MALSSLRTYKLRSFLTLLGIIISVATFMTILSLLLGFTDYLDEKMSKIGTYTFELKMYGVSDFESESAFDDASKKNKHLTFEELEFLQTNNLLTTEIGAKTEFSYAETKFGAEKLVNVPVKGTDPNMVLIENPEIEEGRYFTEAENRARNQVAYLGSETAKELFADGTSPLERIIYINNEPYRVVGIQASEGDAVDTFQDHFIALPMQTFTSKFGRATVDRSLIFVAKAATKDVFDEAAEEIRMLMRAKRRLSSGEADNFGLYTPETLKEIRGNILRPVFIAVLAIPTIILFVGAVVIMNTMLVSITERTNEIGMRRVVGATQLNILAQFLIESMTLTIIGGIVGLLAANLFRWIISLTGFPTSLPVWAVFTAMFVCGIVGLLSGLVPAYRASRLDPIESLQAE